MVSKSLAERIGDNILLASKPFISPYANLSEIIMVALFTNPCKRM